MLFGCYTNQKNICGLHGPVSGFRDKFEQVVNTMRIWANGLSSEAQNNVTELVAFVGQSETDDAQVMVLELLLYCKGAPKMQFVVDCHVVTAGAVAGERAVALKTDFPYTVRISSSRCRLSRYMLGIAEGCVAPAVTTSDELAFFSLRSEPVLVHQASAVHHICRGQELVANASDGLR